MGGGGGGGGGSLLQIKHFLLFLSILKINKKKLKAKDSGDM